MRLMLVAILCAFITFPAYAEKPIKIGAILSLTEIPNFTQPTLKTMEVMVADINEKGGLLGRPLELITQDDKGDPAKAVQVAKNFILRDEIDILLVNSMDHISVALSDVAKRDKIIMLSLWGTDNDMTWKNGHDYTYVIEATPYAQAQQYAISASKEDAKRWAFVATNDVLGRGLVSDIKKALSQLRPDIEFVSEQYPAWGHLSAAHITALKQAKPDAVFTALYDQDLSRFVIEAQKRELLDSLYQQHIALGWYQDADTLGDRAPFGTYTSGCPADLDYGTQREIVEKIKAKTEQPHIGCAEIQTIMMMEFLKAAITQSESVEAEELKAVLPGLKIDTFLGEVEMRAIDNRSTLGYWHGKLGKVDDRPRLTEYFRFDVNALSPDDEWIKEQRK